MILNLIKTEAVNQTYALYPEYNVPMDDLLTLIEDTASEETWKKFYKISDSDSFRGDGGDMWFYRREEMTPQLGRAIYKYSKAYSKGWNSFSHDAAIFPAGNCLDFGTGLGNPWNMKSLRADTNLHLVELSDGIRQHLKTVYGSYPNVFFHENLSEVKNLKFKYVFSNESLGHVRHVNEHLWVLYRLCDMNGTLNLTIEEPDQCGGHVIEQYPDTKKRPPFKK